MFNNSILETLRQFFGLAEHVTDFDAEFLTYIALAFSVASNLGIDHGIDNLSVTNDSAWPDLGVHELNSAFRSWVCMKVKKAFDPPKTAHHLASFDTVLSEMEQTLVLLASSLEPIPLEELINE